MSINQLPRRGKSLLWLPHSANTQTLTLTPTPNRNRNRNRNPNPNPNFVDTLASHRRTQNGSAPRDEP